MVVLGRGSEADRVKKWVSEPVATAFARRVEQLAEALGKAAPPRTASSLTDFARQLDAIVDPSRWSHVWLALAVMTADLPSDRAVVQLARDSEFDHCLSLAKAITARTTAATASRAIVLPPPGTVLLDLSTTVALQQMTGLRRAATETARRWVARGAEPVAWFPAPRAPGLKPSRTATPRRGLRRIEPADLQWPGRPTETQGHDQGFIVPWRCTYITIEVFDTPARADRIRSLARFSESSTAAVVHNLLPITLGERRNDVAGGSFVHYLSALAHFDRLVADSEGTAAEFHGWRRALAAQGIGGPSVSHVPLPADITPASPEVLGRMQDVLLADEGPVVAVVGKRQLRRNHLTVLHAAELLWRRGHRFRLAFLGPAAGDDDGFSEELEYLRERGRPIDVVSSPTDEYLAAAYQLAEFTVMPSLGEGFALPAAESLALGTPVVTSNFGSMREIAEAGGGALLVDPRDDLAVADAMERLLCDPDLLRRLRDEARARPKRTWDQYCDEAWPLLVTGRATD